MYLLVCHEAVQQMTVQVGIAHDSPPFGKRVYHHLLPTENPEGPLQKGGIKWDFSQANKYLPPFLKGDRGGFCCAVVFPKITAAYSLHKQRLTIPPAQQVGFKTTK